MEYERLTADGTGIIVASRDPLVDVLDGGGRAWSGSSGCLTIREGELSGDAILSGLGRVLEDDGEFLVEEGGLPDERGSGRNLEYFKEDKEDVFAEVVTIGTVAATLVANLDGVDVPSRAERVESLAERGSLFSSDAEEALREDPRDPLLGRFRWRRAESGQSVLLARRSAQSRLERGLLLRSVRLLGSLRSWFPRRRCRRSGRRGGFSLGRHFGKKVRKGAIRFAFYRLRCFDSHAVR